MEFNVSNKIWVFLIIVSFMVAGCSYNIPIYDASADNVKKMRLLKSKINVGAFTSSDPGLNSIICRGGTLSVTTPNKIPFEQYIRDALISELQFSGRFDLNSKILISGYVDEVDFSSILGFGKWVIKLTVSSSNSESIIVNIKHEFSSSYVATSACEDVAQAFAPAVQKLINRLVRDRKFESLL